MRAWAACFCLCASAWGQQVFSNFSAVSNYSSANYESFGSVVKLADGTYLRAHRRGTTHASDPGVLVQQTSADTTSWSAETVIFSDATSACGGGNCDLRQAELTPLANGDTVLWWFRYDFVGQAVLGAYWAVRHNGSWGAATQFTSSVSGIGDALWTSYGPAFLLADGTLGKFLYHGADSKTALVKSTDGGNTWPSGAVLVDSGASAIILPTEETSKAYCAGSKCFAFSRGCNALGAACAPWLIVSTDGNATWTKSQMNLAVSDCAPQTGAVSNWNHVSPVLFASAPGFVTLVWAERISQPGSSYCSNLMQLTFDPGTITAGQTAFARMQRLWVETIGSPGFSDWGYPACAMTSSTTVFCEWYSTTVFGGSLANLRGETATAGTVTMTLSGIKASGATIQ